MPRLPDITSLDTVTPVGPPLQGTRGLVESAGQAGDATARIGAQISRSSQELGTAVIGRLKQEQDQQDRLNYVTANSTFLQDSIKTQSDLEADPSNYSKWEQAYQTRAKQVVETQGATITDPALRAQFFASANVHVAEATADLRSKARLHKVDADKAYALGTIDSTMQDIFKPGVSEAARQYGLKNMSDAIASIGPNGTGALTAVQEQELRRVTTDNYVKAWAGSFNDPHDLMNALAGKPGSGLPPAPLPADVKVTVETAAAKYGISGADLERTLQIESGGKNIPAKPGHRAAGIAQFMPETAAAYKVDPNEVGSSIDGAARLWVDNRAQLRKDLGREPTGAEVYLAHQQGSAGANALIQNPDSKAATVTAPENILGNGGTPDMTAKQFVDMWASKFNNAPAKPPAGEAPATTDGTPELPRIANTGTPADLLPPVERFQLYKLAEAQVKAKEADARAEANRLEAEAQKVQAAQQAAATSDLRIAVDRGQASFVDIEKAYAAGNISPSARADLTIKLDDVTKQNAKSADLLAHAAAAGQGGSPLDPKSTDDRKGLNLLYDATAANWTQLPPEQQIDHALGFAAQKGMVPERLQGMIRGGLRGNDPNSAVLAADTLSRLRDLNPQLLNDFAAEDISLGNQIASLTSYGVPAEKAVQMATDALKVSPVERDARGTAFDDLVKATPDAKWIAGKVNSLWTADPTVDPVMAGEFHALARQEYQKTGDIEAARQTALDTVNRVWGRTEVGGDRRYMKFAPEKFYGVSDLSPADNAKWMNEQLLAEVKGGGAARSGPLPSATGIATLNLTPQEQHLYDHHVHNITTGNYTSNEDESYSTIRSIGVEGPGGKEYEIPTVWDGKILSNPDAIKRAAAEGWDKWPSYATPDEADARYEAMHKFMELDQPPSKTPPAMIDPNNPISLDRLLVMPDPTRVAPDGRPVYRVALKGADGIYYGVASDKGVPLAWAPDWAASAENARREAALQAKIDAARAARDALLKGKVPQVGPGGWFDPMNLGPGFGGQGPGDAVP